jgi:hypothetical protein
MRRYFWPAFIQADRATTGYFVSVMRFQTTSAASGVPDHFHQHVSRENRQPGPTGACRFRRPSFDQTLGGQIYRLADEVGRFFISLPVAPSSSQNARS